MIYLGSCFYLLGQSLFGYKLVLFILFLGIFNGLSITFFTFFTFLFLFLSFPILFKVQISLYLHHLLILEFLFSYILIQCIVNLLSRIIFIFINCLLFRFSNLFIFFWSFFFPSFNFFFFKMCILIFQNKFFSFLFCCC